MVCHCLTGPYSLSHGQKKVTIVSTWCCSSNYSDEPTADYYHYTEIMNFLEKINKMGVTIMMITHDMHLMLEYTPRAIVLSDGRILADTSASVVLTDPKLIEEANLKENSLYFLAEKANISDRTSFVQSFIDYERELRKKQ